MKFAPTGEQAEAVRLAVAGDHLSIHAAAGAGKTATLELIAGEKHGQSGLLLAFNKSIVQEAELRFPRWVACKTTHGISYRSHGIQFRHRIRGARMKSSEIATYIGVDPIVYTGPHGTKRAAPHMLAGIVMEGIDKFASTADPHPGWWHMPTPDFMRADRTLFDEWVNVRKELEPMLDVAWADVCKPDGRLPVADDVYRKRWSLSRPRLRFDFILLDEAQDTSDCVVDVIARQREHAQVILVGDANQAIYAWNGAVDAMAKLGSTNDTELTGSFRFGTAIAVEANGILARLGSPMRVRGIGQAGRVGPVDYPDVILTRTNAAAIEVLFAELERGGRPHIVGGASDVVGFCRGARKLIDTGWTDHPGLACFDSWRECREYAADDILGSDLRMLVGMIEEYGADRVVDVLAAMPKMGNASVILSTAHKAKGLEWGSVRLTSDFPDGDPEADPPTPEELRLLYVAATRAKRELDVESVGLLRPRDVRVAP